MADDLGFNLGDVIRMVSSNTASSATATYHLLLQKLTRYNADRHSSGQPSVTDATWLAANRKDKVWKRIDVRQCPLLKHCAICKTNYFDWLICHKLVPPNVRF